MEKRLLDHLIGRKEIFKKNQKIFDSKIFVVSLCVLFFTSTLSFAQNSPGEFDSRIQTEANDYFLKVFWGNDLPWHNDNDDSGILEIQSYLSYPTWNYYRSYLQKNDGYSYFPSGESSTNYGPNRTYGVQIYYRWGKDCSGCFLKWGTIYRQGVTPKLKAPANVNTTLVNGKLKVSWTKATSNPDGYVSYVIKRKANNGAYATVATIAGTNRQFIENETTLVTGDYTYSVQTILSSAAPSDWNRNDDSYELPTVSNSASYYNVSLTTDAEQKGKITLRWQSFSALNGLEGLMLYRNGEALTDLSKTSKNYSDADIIPGVYYNYTLGMIQDADPNTPSVNEAYRTNIVEARSLPNGKISGYVKGKTNSGVPGVVVTATSKIAISNGKTSSIVSYSDTTGNDGYYEIPNLFYGTKADFTVTPQMPDYVGKRFDPETLSRKLELDNPVQNQVNFTDTASFAVSGKVYFAALADSNSVNVMLPLQGAEIWINDKNTQTKTKSDGSYSTTIINGGNYKVEAKFKNHKISIAGNTAVSSIQKSVYSLVTGVDFQDNTTDTLRIKVAASCDAPIGEYATVKISSKNVGKTTAGANLSFGRVIKIQSNAFVQNSTPNQPERGVFNLVLPATQYKVQVQNINELDIDGNPAINSNKLEYFTREYTYINADISNRDTVANVVNKQVITKVAGDTLFNANGSIKQIIKPERRDTTIKSDTTYLAKIKTADFIYRKDLQVYLNNGNEVFTDSVYIASAGKYKYLLSQNDRLPINIKIRESYNYRGVIYNCTLDTGKVYIYDAISDIVDRQDFNLDSTKNVKYQLKIGKPVLEAPYEKTIQIVGKVGGRQASIILTAIVQGERARTATFVTKTPEIPLFVLHDPPGDNSYATISKGTTISSSSTTSYAGGVGIGAYTSAKVGGGTVLPFVGAVSAGISLQAEVEAGVDASSASTTNMSMTFNEDFSTSGEETLVGANGDVYVGASMNMVYALTDVLKYDLAKKDMVRDTALAANLNNFNTTFLYTEYHIKNILLKQLNTLYSISKNTFDASALKWKNGDKSITNDALAALNRSQLEYKASIAAWQNALDKNALARTKAKAVKLPPGTNGIVGNNISLSAGAIYDNSITFQNDTTTATEVSVYLNGSVRLGAFVNSGEANEVELGALGTFRFNWTKSNDQTKSNSITTNYHLEDNDLGDFFSINLGEDKTHAPYTTPVFNVVSGSSSCPHEDNTQYRHLPAMQITGANEQRNVPADKAAKFQIIVSNRSESDETVEYAIKLDPASNPDGARVLVGGQDVTNGQATYYIPTGKNFTLPVEVFKGPLSSTYENLSLVIFSTCDNTLDDISESNIAKPSVKVNAYFQNACSAVDLFIPGDNWVVNQSNQNRLFVAFSKYDASGASPLTLVGLQYRKLNTDYDNGLWQTVITVPKKDLVNKYYDYSFDVSGLPDGNYEIRAISICGGVDVNYSPVYKGKIDRTSAVTFGLPSPRNGILTVADIIGVSFNKDIVFNDVSKPIQVTLKRKDDGTIIPATIIGDGRNFQIKTMPEGLINNYENVELVALVKNLFDASGNKVVDSVQWSFVVNLSPVYWSPNSIVMNTVENQPAKFSTSLINKSALLQSISITKYPTWLTPSAKTGKIVAQGKLDLDFSVSSNLNTGIYTDTVIAVIDNKQQLLYVTVNVLRDPPTWTVNPAKYKYNMSFTTQFSIDQTDTLTSKDVRDKIGVFVGKECRGVAQIEYDRENNKYVAFVTAYSNDPANEEMTVHFWDAYPGLEYQGKERLTFVANGTLGNLVNPYILHPEGVYQTIPLKKGWTWVSFNVEQTDMTLKKVLANLNPSEGDVIKTLSNNNAYSQYSKTLGWAGPLASVNLYNSYMIYVAKPDTIRVLGNFITEPANVRLLKGWNWTGYPMAINMDINTYLKNYNPANGSQLVSQEEFAQYNASTKTWSGSLKYLRPGKGYKFYTETDGFMLPAICYIPTTDLPKELTQSNLPPVNDPTIKTVINNISNTVNSTENNLSVTTNNLENNMSVTAVINQGGQIINNTTNRYETYVYVENKLVNIVNQTTLNDGSSVSFLTVNGDKTDESKKVNIKVYDRKEKREYNAKINNTINQINNEITGTIDKPVELILEGDADLAIVSQASKAIVSLGDTVTYTIKYKNNGPDLAVNVSIMDTLGSAFEFVSASNGIVYDAIKRTVNANKLQVALGEENVYQIVLKALVVGNQSLGRGRLTANNEINYKDNTIAPLYVSVTDKRANISKLLIPTLFTPNGDGINDVFEVVGLNEFYVSNSLTVFNRSYNVVYKKQNYQNDWNGDTLPMGSYGYILKAIDKDGKEVVFKGFVTIVYQ